MEPLLIYCLFPENVLARNEEQGLFAWHPTFWREANPVRRTGDGSGRPHNLANSLLAVLLIHVAQYNDDDNLQNVQKSQN